MDAGSSEQVYAYFSDDMADAVVIGEAGTTRQLSV
jgi:hypothetical protein